ncbi:MAG: hypothetical protein NTY41_08600 [Proteobacteria bacterium]|nr:hypothetical protein [Pseudomonadota bacterium]
MLRRIVNVCSGGFPPSSCEYDGVQVGRHMALYAREQAYCHFSPSLLANLRKHWQDASTN